MIQTVLMILLVAAAASDWKFRKVSNTLAFPFLLGGLMFQLLQGRGWVAAGGVGMAFILTLLPVILRGMGMGDQKLLMSVGAWTGPSDLYTLFLYSIIFCLIPLLFLPWRWKALRQNVAMLSAGWKGHQTVWLPSVERSALSIPYAVHLLFAYILFIVVGGKLWTG